MLLQVECVQTSCDQELVEREKTSGTLCSLKAWKIYTCKDDSPHKILAWYSCYFSDIHIPLSCSERISCVVLSYCCVIAHSLMIQIHNKVPIECRAGQAPERFRSSQDNSPCAPQASKHRFRYILYSTCRTSSVVPKRRV